MFLHNNFVLKVHFNRNFSLKSWEKVCSTTKLLFQFKTFQSPSHWMWLTPLFVRIHVHARIGVINENLLLLLEIMHNFNRSIHLLTPITINETVAAFISNQFEIRRSKSVTFKFAIVWIKIVWVNHIWYVWFISLRNLCRMRDTDSDVEWNETKMEC